MFKMLKKIKQYVFVFIIAGLFCPVLAQAQTTQSYPPQAILYAAFTGNAALVQDILSAGTDTDIRTDSGDSALHLAMFQRNVTVVRLLLTHGFDPNARNENGETPLHRAVIADNRLAAEQLLLFRADKNIKNNAGRTPLEEANRIGDRRQLVFLLM